MVQKLWSKEWKSSTQSRKQRKYVYKAPLHIKHKMCSSGLSKELRKEYGFRSIPVRKGDTVKAISGQFKGQSGKVTKVSLSRMKVYVDGFTIKRSDGTDSMYPVHPSNLEIIKLDLGDKRRSEKLDKVKEMNKKDGKQ